VHIDDLTALHAQHLRPGFGSTTADELDYIQRLIAQHKPKRFIEIGTASGLTTGFIARFMAENGGAEVTSIDLSDRFFGQTDQPVGYLAKEIYQGRDVTIDIHPRTSALNLARLDGGWDMAFVDANHQHPWPTLDTLALAPFLRGPKIVIHHDLQLYRRFRKMRGIGPRVLFNEMPDSHRQANIAGGWNIFSLDLSLPAPLLQEVAIGALSMPWTSQPPLTGTDVARFETLLRDHYTAHLLQEFQDCRAANRAPAPRRAMLAARRAVAQVLEHLGLRPS